MNANLISYVPNLRVLDCTLRDGGLVNDSKFSDDFAKALYQADLKAGVDYMEFGYKCDKKIFSPDRYGKWKFCDEEDIRAIVGDNDTDLKISVMADVGRCDYKKDIIPKADSVIDTIRVATYVNAIPTAIDMVEDAKNKGYEATVNIMAVSKVNGEDLKNSLELLGQSSVDVIYLVDSFGSFYPEQIRRLTDQYMEVADKYGKKVGIHAHNNQQLAFANTIEAMNKGVGATYLDATVNGLGRGAGNCHLEGLLSFLRNPKYKTIPILKFVENYILPLREQGLTWGYDIPYLLTGQLNAHPSFAIKFIKEGRKDYYNFFHELVDDTL
ncbi:MAG: aldolase catalytic domain-containing protein [Clostridiales bacterium]|nr:aldolase catalytic domain-containing protein [Clostridiales bacterium]MCD7880386.1 aldolase catalytic domain-containing protein [Clostridiales bacterium]